jgi:hypothetical protein
MNVLEGRMKLSLVTGPKADLQVFPVLKYHALNIRKQLRATTTLPPLKSLVRVGYQDEWLKSRYEVIAKKEVAVLDLRSLTVAE